MEYAHLTQITETSKHINHNKYWRFCSVFKHLPQFATDVLIYGCCASVSLASLVPLLGITPCSMLRMRRRVSVVVNLQRKRNQKPMQDNAATTKHKESLFPWMGHEFSLEKSQNDGQLHHDTSTTSTPRFWPIQNIMKNIYTGVFLMLLCT